MNFLPMPKKISCGSINSNLLDPCLIFFHLKISSSTIWHFLEILASQMRKTFKCDMPNVVISQNFDVSAHKY